jgi:hypothetical protein
MSEGIRTLIYPVRNVEQTKSLLKIALGTDPYIDAPYYVGFRTDGSETWSCFPPDPVGAAW